MTTFDLTINEIAKIEGKCSVTVQVKDGSITELKFAIDEYKRFYTKALRGKDVVGMPQLACRICGTCSNAHLLCGIKAAERALSVSPSQQTVMLRRLLNFGLNIRDHALHLCVFVLPDMLGVDNILELDENVPEERQILEDTFAIKAAGNRLGLLIGGKSVHAPYPMVGGFARLPKQTDVPMLISELETVRPAVLRLIGRFTQAEETLERDIEFTALMDDTYSFLDGALTGTDGLVVPEEQYGDHLEKIQIPHSHASGYKYNDKIAMVGAIARVNLGKEKLHKRSQQDAHEALERFPSKNIFHNNLAQAIEILHCIDSSIDILQSLQIKPERPVAAQRKAGIGVAVIEAPRGALYYRLEIDEKGIITDIQIVVPTGQNQIGIEQSLYEYFAKNMHKSQDDLKLWAERIVRAYDPCMSCASHFLRLIWKEG